MMTSGSTLLHILAIICWAIAIYLIINYGIKNIKLVVSAARKEPTFRGKDSNLPLRSGIYITLSGFLITLGVMLWNSNLAPLAPFGFLLSFLVGFSVWINLRIRKRYSDKRLDRQEGKKRTN